MTGELFGDLDVRGLESERDRLERAVGREQYREYFGDPLEGLLDDEATDDEISSLVREEWGSLNSQIWLSVPNDLHDGAEVRFWKECWWLGRRGDDYWVVDPDDISDAELVRIG